MKRVSLILSIIIFIIGVVIFSIGTIFYFGEYDNFDNIEKIVMNYPTINMKYGDVFKLEALVYPEEYNNVKLIWTSSDHNFVSVSQDGTVTILRNDDGEVLITAKTKNGKHVASSIIKVEMLQTENIKLDNIYFEKEEQVIEVGQTILVNPQFEPSNVINKKLLWLSSNLNIAEVDSEGNVIGKKVGEAIITSTTINNKKASYKLKVISNKDATLNIQLNKEYVEMYEGSEDSLIATITPNNSSSKITWISGNNDIVSVDEKGRIKALKEGETIITAKLENEKVASCKVRVVKKTDDTSIILNNVNVTIKVNETTKLSVSINDKNDRVKAWKSDNEQVAIVDNKGIVTAKGEGVATITVESEKGKKAECKVNVIKNIIEVTDIKLDETKISLNEGDERVIKAELIPSNAENQTINWISSNTEVAIVDKNGKITAKSTGTAIITARAGNGVSQNCEVEVKRKVVEVESVNLDVNNLSLVEGDSRKLNVTLIPSNPDNSTLSWTSSNTNVATVDDDGNVTALKEGTAIITVTSSNNRKAQCNVVVTKQVIVPTSISLNTNEISIHVGNITTLVATVNPLNSTNQNIEWTSSNPNVATVDENGLVVGKNNGTTTITVKTSNGKEAKCTVTVINRVIEADSISLDNETISLVIGKTQRLNAVISPLDTTNQTKIWMSSNENIATVDNTGMITAVSEGEATITVKTSNGKEDKCTVIVTMKVVEASEVKLYGDEIISLPKGNNITLQAIIIPTNTTNQTVKWTSSNPEVVAVVETGKENGRETAEIVGKAPGTATITIETSNGKTDTCTVNVTVAATSVNIHSTLIRLTVGSSHKLTYTIAPSDTTDSISSWTSSNRRVATVDKYGNVTGRSSGTAIITATTSNGIKDTCEVIVTVEATSVNIREDQITLDVGASKTLETAVSPSNTTNKTLRWTSSDSNVAVVTQAGVVRGKSQGTAIITATTSNGKTDTCEVVVNGTIDINEPTDGIRINSSYNLRYTHKTGDNDVITFKSLNDNIATVNNSGKVTGVNLGTTTIKAYVNGEEKSSVIVKIIPNVLPIDITNQSSHVYKSGIYLDAKHPMQDFDIANFGTNNEIYYFAVPYNTGLFDGKDKEATIVTTAEQNKELLTGRVFKVNGNNLETGNNKQVMYINNSGQGQNIVKEPNNDYFWFADQGAISCSGDNCAWNDNNKTFSCTSSTSALPNIKCNWWGGRNSNIARFRFSPNSYGNIPERVRSYNFGTIGQRAISVWVAADWQNDLIATITKTTLNRNNFKAKIYKASDFINGIKTLLYGEFDLERNSDNEVLSSIQGFAISGGYLYLLRSWAKDKEAKNGQAPAIEKYNVYGTLMEFEKTRSGYENSKLEPQGLKVYNNEIYYGIRYVKGCVIEYGVSDTCKHGTGGGPFNNAIFYMR